MKWSVKVLGLGNLSFSVLCCGKHWDFWTGIGFFSNEDCEWDESGWLMKLFWYLG